MEHSSIFTVQYEKKNKKNIALSIFIIKKRIFADMFPAK